MHLRKKLAQHFGHDAFRPGQEEVIAALLAGRSALAIFPTGGGKSICYQLPALLLPGLTLVVSPLVALMKDQVDRLRGRDIAAARLDSSLGKSEVAELYEAMRKGRLKLLYVAPERFSSEDFLACLQRTRLALLAIDEAHCISEWGHHFRPEYLRLARVARQLQVPRCLALTATATPEVAADICREFKIEEADRVQTSFHRANLDLQITPVAAAERLDFLTRKLCEERRFSAIVYVTLQETAEKVATHLAKNGVRAQAYHAGLADEVRAQAQEDFMRGATEVMVATIAFGMGIDKADIRAVYHYNLPKSLENYQQEIGRAGRDGLPAHCEMLACGDDLIVLQNFSLGDTPTEAALRQLVDFLLRNGSEFDFSRYELARSTDVRQSVLETVLTYLEKAEVLEPLGSFYTNVQVGFQQPEAKVLAGHAPARQKLLRALFSSGRRGWRWLTIPIDEAAAATGETRERILQALHFLEAAGEVELRMTGVRHRYRLLPEATERRPADVCEWLQGLVREREAKDQARLETVVQLIEDAGCSTRHLLRYFGEKAPKTCGHCANCRSPRGRKKKLPRSPRPRITVGQLQSIQDLLDEKLPALRAPRQLTRFLCGLSSPATTRDRLSRHDAFGLLAEVPFATVLQQLESMGFR